MMPIRLEVPAIWHFIGEESKTFDLFWKTVGHTMVRMHFNNNILFPQAVRRQQMAEGEMLDFPGARTWWTEKLEMFDKDSYKPLPVYRVLDNNGIVIDPSQEPKVSCRTRLENVVESWS